MTASYRNKFGNYKQEHEANYAPCGSIFPVLVDSFSGKTTIQAGAGSGLEAEEFAYKDYLYCDGSSVKIRDYPQLYNVIRNEYGGSTAQQVLSDTVAGGIKYMVRLDPADSNSPWFVVVNQDSGVQGNVKLPYPYGTNFRFFDNTGNIPAGNGLGALNPNEWSYNTFYGTEAPTQAELQSLSLTNTEYAYKIVFPDSVDPTTFTTLAYVFGFGNHPATIFSKSFSLGDYPYNVGTFTLPDYRDKIVVGLGGVDGDGSPTVENALVNRVGQTGGQWYISKDDLLDGGVFFTVGDVRTRGYSDIQADIFTYLTGDVSYRVGPLDDHIFTRPAEHNHKILSCEPDELNDNEVGAINWDEFAVMYSKTRANISLFEPATSGGVALGHSHGLTRDRLNDPNAATYGNTVGIGGQDPNTPANVLYDVSDPILANTAVYDDISLEPHGPGTGEYEGFNKPGIAQSNRYLAFGYKNTASINNPGELKLTRSVTYTMDFTGYTEFFIYAIAGNDSNGGERPNNPEESLIVEFSDGSETIIIPSGRRFNIDNGDLTGFDQYDAVYAYWTASTITIPAALQNQPNQTVKIKMVVRPAGGGDPSQGTGGTEQGDQVPAGNDNANDMYGIQAIGLRGGITTEPPNPEGEYPITGSTYIGVLSITYDAANNWCLVTTEENHGFLAGKTVEIAGAIPEAFNGSFVVQDNNQLGGDTFTYEAPAGVTNVAAGSSITARLAPGYFVDITTTPPPRMYVVDDNTGIGGKTEVFVIPGTGVTFQSEEQLGNGTINTDPVPAETGVVALLEVNLKAPGGGGGGTFSSGGDAGYSYASFELDGNFYTIYAYGGEGGDAGDLGGGGGTGGSFLIPQELINNPLFTYTADLGANGNSSTGTTPGTGGGDQFEGNPIGGSGGSGVSETFQTTTTTGWFNQTGTVYTPPAQYPNEASRTTQLRVAGGGGGGGNGNANSGCQAGGFVGSAGPQDGSARGGTGGSGALITANIPGNYANLQFAFGTGGGAGVNARDGYNNGPGYEYGPVSSGGGGASSGGSGGLGAYGNGATGGAGGGCTAVFFEGAIPIIGAGGGGGGGGSGGGYNGGSAYDGCYVGGNSSSASTNLHARTSAIDFTSGANGTQGGCTAGGGGGGGGGSGPSGAANGGTGGQAGVGHNGNGGGTGGQRGDSAYRSDYCTASYSEAGNGGGPGSTGGAGYVQINVTATIDNQGAGGGGGGQGASISFTLANTNIAMVAGVQSPGAGGSGGAQTGGGGVATISYIGTEGGGEVEGGTTSPVGRYYLCDETGIPSGTPYDGPVWLFSSADGDTEDMNVTPTTPGIGTSATNKFSMLTSAGAPTYNGLATKYIPFIGPGTREYIIGNFDMSFCNKIRFSIICGNNNNGGATPEEDLLIYYKEAGGTTTTLLDSVMTVSQVSQSWQELEVLIPENSNLRNNGMQLILRQTRTANQDDNATNTEDNYGISAISFFYDSVTTREFVATANNTIRDVDYVDVTVDAQKAGLVASEGSFEMSSSTPISTTALVVPESNIPLITKYHRVKYLIKSR